MNPPAATWAARLAPPAWPWPLPAGAAWALGWALWAAARRLGAAEVVALGLALAGATALALMWPLAGRWRRGIAAAGFPLSAVAAGLSAAVPAWVWLLPLLPLALLYPLRAWRDAPFFPTPADALQGLDRVVQPPPARVLDAGCGLGHGLHALRRCWPQAALSGVEWSPLLAALARWRCRLAPVRAQVRRGDLWAGHWQDHDLVYLFQRPESMARAWAKACAQMPGGWLVSLEFAVPGVAAVARLDGADGRPLWVYRVPGPAAAARGAAKVPAQAAAKMAVTPGSIARQGGR